MELKNRKIVVVGLARSGVAVARFLVDRGALVTVTDMKDKTALAPYLEKLSGLPINLELGRHEEYSFLTADLIVVSPGVPMEIGPIQLARARKRRVISEIELASIFIDAPMVAITGTNGKTTTTTLTGEIFRACGFKTFVGGNIGNPLIDLVSSALEVERVVAEISSFQLEGIISFHPQVAVLLNITEDHLDRYTTFGEYAAAKARIFENLTSADFAVLNVDDPMVAPLAGGRMRGRVVPMSRLEEQRQGIFYRDGLITFRWEGREELFPTAGYRLKGVHNLDNIMAALASSLLLGCDAQKAAKTVEEFRGLPHRMELVATINGVSWYNDSKGTNVGSVVKSLESFEKGVTLIAGGKDKGGDYFPLAELVRERVVHMILIGEAKDKISKALGHLTDTRPAESLEEAVALARDLTAPGGTVLFSPACSSFDMFKNYEERGERFAALVKVMDDGGTR
ncbi:MAG TPA: UDP-N-acetylmuramoyl-L-alanine--D-glutamate ligase [Geobacteraceae bacterium]|nr:UDP-N-acetylmuramoyl-L-alanine--D-glutamate ligase [Geobacteraceae bacterium]